MGGVQQRPKGVDGDGVGRAEQQLQRGHEHAGARGVQLNHRVVVHGEGGGGGGVGLVQLSFHRRFSHPDGWLSVLR